MKIKKQLPNSITKPIGHKKHYYTFFTNTDIYYKLIHLWSKKGPHEFFINDKKYVFSSKKGNVYRKNENGELKQCFEYIITNYRDEDNPDPKKCYFKFMPRLKDTFQKDGNKFKLMKGEGAELEIITVYYSMIESQNLLYEIFKQFGIKEYWNYQDQSKGSIRQNEHYIRYDADKEKLIANTLKDMQELISNGSDGETKITINKEENKYKLFSFRSECFNELGFNNNNKQWVFAIKTYRAKEWRKFNELDPLYHPKLEIYMDEDKKEGKRKYPKLSDYQKLTEEMYNIIGNILLWSGVNREDLISDMYFDSEDINNIVFQEKENVLDKIKKRYERMAPEIRKEVIKLPSQRDYISCLLKYDEVTYQTLTKWTNLGPDRIKQITYDLKDVGLIKTYKGNNVSHGFFGAPINITFSNEKMKNITKAILRSIEVDLEENYQSFKERKIKRAIRREKFNITMKKKIFLKKVLNNFEKQILFDSNIINEINNNFISLTEYNYVNIELMPDADMGG